MPKPSPKNEAVELLKEILSQLKKMQPPVSEEKFLNRCNKCHGELTPGKFGKDYCVPCWIEKKESEETEKNTSRPQNNERRRY